MDNPEGEFILNARKRMIDMLNLEKITVKVPKYKVIEGEKEFDRYKFTEFKRKDWLMASKLENGKAARVRLRAFLKELTLLTEEVKKRTSQLDKM